MTKITNDELSELCGREVDREFRLELLKEAEETGEPIAKIADKYAMPPTFIMKSGQKTFEYNGETFTPESWHERWPYRRIVLIKTRENNI